VYLVTLSRAPTSRPYRIKHSKYESGRKTVVASRNTAYQHTEESTYHSYLPIPVCKLVAEEIGKSDVLDSTVTLSGGLCGVVSTPSGSAFDDKSPIGGLSDVMGGGVRRLSITDSEGKEEKEDGVDVGMPSISPGLCRVLAIEPMVSTPESCGDPRLKDNEL
jgi:hypothetical protein